MMLRRLVTAVTAIVFCTACAKTAPDAPISHVWATRCAKCHGANGAGDGEAAQRLDPKPRDLRDVLWQSARTDQQIGTIIIKGGASLDRSSLMPPHLDLEARKAELVRYVRALAAK